MSCRLVSVTNEYGYWFSLFLADAMLRETITADVIEQRDDLFGAAPVVVDGVVVDAW